MGKDSGYKKLCAKVGAPSLEKTFLSGRRVTWERKSDANPIETL